MEQGGREYVFWNMDVPDTDVGWLDKNKV